MASLSQKMYPATCKNKREKARGIHFLCRDMREGHTGLCLKIWMKYLLCCVLTAAQSFPLWIAGRSNSNLNQTSFSLLFATWTYPTIHIACTTADQKGAGLKSAIN